MEDLTTSGEFGTVRLCMRDEEQVEHKLTCAKCSAILDYTDVFRLDVTTGELLVEQGDISDPSAMRKAACKCGNKTFTAEPEDTLCGYCRHMAEKND
jgi:hypothetical protein